MKSLLAYPCRFFFAKKNQLFLSIGELLVKQLVFWLILGLTGLPIRGEADTNAEIINREFQLKTAYLFHFAELTEWPAAQPITICLQGASPLRQNLPALEGQLINGQAVHILLDQQNDAAGCRILFLSDNTRLTPVLTEQSKLHHILMVSDADGFAAQGGMVQFALRDNKLKLVINLSAVNQAGLKLSSKLLRMAEILE